MAVFHSSQQESTLLTKVLGLYVSWTIVIRLCLICLCHSMKYDAEKAKAAQDRIPKKRFLWEEFMSSMPDKHFQ